jgi:hypothetical protein
MAAPFSKDVHPAFVVDESDEILAPVGIRETDFIVRPPDYAPDFSPSELESESGATV